MLFGRYKKISAVLSALALCMTVSSCGNGGEGQTSEFTGIEMSDGKKTIKLAIMGLNDDFKTAVNDFNKSSEEYEIEVTDNFSLTDDPVTRINLEIMSGNTPDIIDSIGLPMESYVEKGLFVDLYEFIDSDPGMCREDFLENIFNVYEVNGGLYENVSSFYMNAIAGKASVAGEMQGRTADDFIDLAEKYPDKKFMDERWSKNRTFGFFMRNGWKSFIDSETGKCDFNNEKFLRILEFCNTFPDKVDDSYSLEPNWRSNEIDDLMNGKTLFSSYGLIINDFYALRKLEYNVLGEPAAIVGYPYLEGNGLMIQSSSTNFSVFENSSVKEGAWEFLRYFYSDEYQKSVLLDYSLPVKKSAVEFAAEDAKKGFYLSYLDEYTDEYGINTDEDNQKIIDLINGAACRVNTSEDFVYSIIREEADVYFSGQKSAKETAEIIQNRVQNYLDENR